MTIRLQDNVPTDVITAPQTVTTGWVDCGEEIDVRDFEQLAVFCNVDINAAANFRIRFVGLHTSGDADEYALPILDVQAGVVNVDQEYFELTDDADQKVILYLSSLDLIPYIKVQISAGTAGATAGQMDELKVIGQSKRSGGK